MLQLLAKLIKALNSDSSPAQISVALVLGMVMGLTPLWSLHNLLVLFLACIIRINFSALILAFGLFSGLAYLLDPLFIYFGELMLTNSGLQELWTNLYRSDWWRLSHFNHTATLGSLLLALTLSIPLLFISRWLIVRYREHVMKWVQKTRLGQWLRGSKFYEVYCALTD